MRLLCIADVHIDEQSPESEFVGKPQTDCQNEGDPEPSRLGRPPVTVGPAVAARVLSMLVMPLTAVRSSGGTAAAMNAARGP